MQLPAHLRRDLYDLLPERPSLLVVDFDGVLTDNRVYVREDGTETVACSRGDGLGMTLLRKHGFPAVILSSESNPVVSARARKLKVECIQGVRDKAEALEDYFAEHGLDPASVVFIGNDLNDIGGLRLCGCGLAVSDAHPLVLRESDGVLSFPGGLGAVREACELILVKLGCPLAYPIPQSETKIPTEGA